LAAIVKVTTKVVKWIGGNVLDVLDFAVDEIIKPVFEFVGDTIKALMDDPLTTIAKIVAIATGNAWAIPLIDGASIAAKGGSFGDVMKGVAISYVAGKVGGKLGDWAGAAAGNALGEGVSAGTRELVATMVSQGTVGATTAILYGEDPFEAFVRGGISAAVSAGMGKIGEKIGFESTVTDPATGKTTTRAIPNVVQNMISTALAAELTGQEITPALMAGALTRSLITAELVRGYIDKDQSMGDREIGYVTAAIQRTTAIALSGGSGEQAAAALQGVMSAYGMEALHDAIDNSRIGDFINNSIDKMSGDYQETVRIADELDAQVLIRNAAYEGYESLRTEINDDLSALETMQRQLNMARDPATEERGENEQAPTAYDNLLAKYQEAAADLNAKYAEYKPRMDAYEQQIIDAHDKFTELETELAVAQGNLQVSTERLNEELQPVYSAAERAYVTTMSPNFNEEEYKALNGLSDDTDAFTHYLTNGQHGNVYTNQADYDRAINNNRNQAITKILEAAGIDPSGLSTDQMGRIVNVINDTYGTPQELEELLNNEAAINGFAGALSKVVADASEYSNAVLGDTTRARLESLGFDTAGGMDGEALTNEEKAALHTVDNRGSNEISLGADTTWQDVADNNAVVTYDADGNREWRNVSVSTIEWDPEYGRVTVNTSYDEQGRAWTTTRTGEDGNLVEPMWINIYYGADSMQGGDYLNTIKNAGKEMGYADSMIDFVSGVLDYAKESGNEWIIDTAANVVKAGGGILGAFNGVVALAGIAPPDTALGKFADALVKLGENTNTNEYKANLAEIQQMMGQPTDPNAPWYDRALEKAGNILGAFAEHPTTFLAEYIGVEATQELVPLLIGGGASLAAKGAARFAGMGAQVSARIGSKAGISAAIATDIAESFGGTASEAYDTALEVALKTGMSEKDAKAYALNLAVETGTVAAFMTAAFMGVGGMALEKALIGDGVGGKMATVFGELTSRALEGGKIMIKEGVTESIEEGVATAYREGHLYQIDPTRDVAGEVAGAALMGFIVGGPVAGGAYGVAQTGDAVSNAISAINPQVNAIIKNTVATVSNAISAINPQVNAIIRNTVAAGIIAASLSAATVELNNLGITDPVIQNNIMNTISDSNYTSTEEVSTAFLAAAVSSNQDYKPTQAEIDALVGAKGDADIQARVDTYIDPRYTDPAEAANMFIDTFGYTPTDAEIAQFVGQTAESTQETAIGDYVDPRQTTETEARAFFDSLGYTPTDAEVAQFVGQTAESTQETAIGDYVDPRQTTETEARAFFDSLGYTPTDAEVAQFVGQNSETPAPAPDGAPGAGLPPVPPGRRTRRTAENTQESNIGTYVDPRQVTEAEARQYFADLGYTPTDAEIAAYVGQGNANFASTTQTQVGTYVDPRQMTAAEATAALQEQGIANPTAEQIAQFVGQGDANFETMGIENLTAYADPLITTYEEAKQFFNDLGFTPSKEQIEQFVGSTTETEQQSAIATFVDPLYTDAAEAKAFLEGLGYTPTDAEVARFTGQVNEAQQETAIGEYVDPRLVNAEEVVAAYEALGLERPTDADIQALIGQYMESDLAGKAEENLPTARYNSIMDILNNFTGEAGVSEEMQAALDIVKNDMINALGDLGLEVAAIDQTVNSLTDAVGAIASGDADATGLYGYIDEAVQNLKDAGLTNEQVTETINEIIGGPATGDAEATGIYATLDALGTNIDNLNDLSVDDVSTIVSDALSELNNLSTEDVTKLITDALTGLNDLNTEDVTKLITDALTGLNDLNTEDVETIVSNALSGIENLSSEDVETVVNNIIGSPATEDAAATGIYALVSNLNNLGTDDVETIVSNALSGLENISEEDVQGVVNNIVGAPATDDAGATGIYAVIDSLNNLSEEDVQTIVNDIVDDLNNLGTDDVETIVSNALSGLENISEEDVQGVVNNIVGAPATDDAGATGIYAVIDSLNNLSDEDVQTIVNDIVDDLNNLGTDDVETIVSNALSGLENISEEDVQGVVNNIVGAPATDDAGATGIYAVIDSLNNLSDEDVSGIVANIVGQPATDDSEATGLYATIGDLNNISEEEVTAIVTEALGGLENISTDDVSNVVNSIIGNPATDDTDASGIYGYIDNGLSSVQESVLDKLSEYEDAGIARDEALSTAIADVAEDLGTTEDNILAQIGTPATGDAAATGIYAALDNNTDAILEILGAPATDDTAATGIYGYIDSAVDNLGTDLAALAGNVGTAAEYDADGNLLTEATGIYAQVDALMAQGMTNAEAIASLAVEFGVAVTDLTNLINDQTSTITEDVGEVAEDVSDIAGLLGEPAVADNPLTEEDESTDPTGLFGIIAGYETAGQERDEAIDSAFSDLAEQLGITKTDILDQLNLGLDQIETLITNSQTGLEEKIDKAVEDIGVDIGDMETEILDKMAEYELAGIDRDEALTTAISDLATELGLTEEALLDQITSTETNLLTELGLTEESILDQINEAETSLSDRIIETETNLSGEIDAVAALVGKAAQEVTQADIDFVADIIAQAEVINDANADNPLTEEDESTDPTVIQQYDVTGDGVIDINDQTLLESILAGNTDVTVADTSIFAPTGVYDAILDTETALQEDIDQTQDQITEMEQNIQTNIETALQENIDQTQDQITETEQNIQTNIEQEAARAGLRDFLGMAMASPDMGGQQVTVKTPDPMQLNYLYDFSSIFANPTQQNLFPSPYAKGGQVEDTTDKLLRIIGGS
jgi:hypothetical protein